MPRTTIAILTEVIFSSVTGASKHNVETMYCRRSFRMRFRVEGAGDMLSKSRTCNRTRSHPNIGTLVSSSFSFKVFWARADRAGDAGWDTIGVDVENDVAAVAGVGGNGFPRRLLTAVNRAGAAWGRWICSWGVRWIWNCWPRGWRSSDSRTWWLLQGR